MTTPNLNLTLPTGTDQINNDVQALATNFQNIDNGFGNLSENEIHASNYKTSSNTWSDAIQAALNAASAGSYRVKVVIPKGSYTINSTITWDVGKACIESTYALLQPAVGMTGFMFSTTSTATDPYENHMSYMKGIHLKGNSSTKGIQYTGTSDSTGSSRINLVECKIEGFAIGESYENNSYIITHYATDLVGNTQAISNASGVSNSGERFTYFGGTISGNPSVFAIGNANADFYFVGTSFDFNTSFGTNSGIIQMIGCHIEFYTSSTAYMTLNANGATLEIIGGKILKYASGSNTGEFATTTDTNSIVLIRDAFVEQDANSGQYFLTGNGILRMKGTTGWQFDTPFYGAQNNNLLYDGGFEKTAIFDDIVANQTASNVTLALNTTAGNVHSGTQSLQITKQYGAGTNCSVDIFVKIDPRLRTLFNLWYLVGSGIGTFDLKFGYTTSSKKVDANVLTFVGTCANDGVYHNWQVNSLFQTPPPSWAQYVVIRLDMFNFGHNGNESFYIDDVYVQQV